MKERVSLFNLPNILTACNLLSGILAIIFVFLGRLDWAPWFIFLGAIFDWLDGFTARMLKQFSELGKQMDSLADMVTFGVAPGVFMIVVLVLAIDLGNPIASSNFNEYALQTLNDWKLGLLYNSSKTFVGIFRWLPFAGLIIPFFSLFRLAKFNIDTRQSESFIGLNTPSNTLFFTTFVLVLSNYYSQEGYPDYFVNYLFQPLFLVSLILVMSMSLISEIPFFGLKFKSFTWKGNEIRYIFLLISLILIVVTGVWSIALIVFLYLVMSLMVKNDDLNKQVNE
ncbi:MAG: CDP-alcohol phosphatidyltransferase family protein [Crocinitomicaceae bacterium]